jgi:hypothetical protein
MHIGAAEDVSKNSNDWGGKTHERRKMLPCTRLTAATGVLEREADLDDACCTGGH